MISVQPRIRLLRSFDQRSHSYLGYALWLRGKLGDEEAEFSVGIGPGAQAKQALQIGDLVQGASLPVANPRLEPVEYYKTSALKGPMAGEVDTRRGPRRFRRHAVRGCQSWRLGECYADAAILSIG